MKNRDLIGDISHIMDIPASTLRYWEREGLVDFTRDGQNNYRRWDTSMLFELSDVAFYRSLSVPVKELRQLAQMSVGALDAMLAQCEARLSGQLEQLGQSLLRVRQRQAAIAKARELAEPRVVRFRAPAIYDVVFEKDAGMRHRLTDPYAQVVYCLSRAPRELGAGVLSNFQNLRVIRPADDREKPYLNCLLRLEYHKANNRGSAGSNVAQLRRLAESCGGAGDIIGSYLISAFEEKRYTFYDCMIALPGAPGSEPAP